MTDLSTTYLGLQLKNPLVVSPSPLSEDIGNLRKMEDSGAAAVVLHSLFEEQVSLESEELDRYLSEGTESFAESLTYLPDMTRYNRGPDGYLELVRQARQAVGIPVIASLNGVSPGGWLNYAQKIEEAGASALEMNIYFLAADPNVPAGEVEQMYCNLVTRVKENLHIPVAVKLGPYFSAMANFARSLDRAGANALVLFNRFYQPDFDLENLEVVPIVHLSSPHELLLRLHWVSILSGRLNADLAVTGGVHSADDVLKSMMAGAKVAMMTSALLQNGISHLASVRADLVDWMEEHEYTSIQQMQGSLSLKSVASPAAFERANYMRVLSSYTLRTFGPWRMGMSDGE